MPLVPGSADLPPELQELLDESTEMIDANITLTQQRAIKKQSKLAKAAKEAGALTSQFIYHTSCTN